MRVKRIIGSVMLQIAFPERHIRRTKIFGYLGSETHHSLGGGAKLVPAEQGYIHALQPNLLLGHAESCSPNYLRRTYRVK